MIISNLTAIGKFLLFCLLFTLAGCYSSKSDVAESAEHSKMTRIDKAMEQEFEMTKDPATNEVPREKLLLAHKMYQQQARQRNAQMAWEERGPGNVGGRTRAILVDANDAMGNTVWAGGAGGGLWKSTSIRTASASWSPVNDLFENMAISAIAQDPNDADNIYFGTGEGWFNADAIRGLGIWKSADGGTSWNRLASTAGSDFNYIQKIVINAAGTVFVSTRNAGVQRSTDGGANWIKVLGSGSTASSNRAADLAISTSGDLYATMGIFTEDGIYKSVNNGDTWTMLTNGLPASGYERIELATAPSNNNRVYALFQDESNNQCLGIYRTDNGGTSWSAVDNPSAFGMTSFSRNQAWYDLIAGVDPNDADRLFIGGVDLLVSDDAGSSWTQVSQWYGGAGFPYVHADQHEIVFFPGSSTEILFGNDGGIFYTNDGNTSSPTFISKSNSYNVTQFYDCAIHPGAGVNNYLAGAQDNGTQQFDTPGIDNTNEVTGGDGAFCHIDQDQPDIQISSYVYNAYRITSNGWGSYSNFEIGDDIGRFINPTDYDNGNNILYGAGEDGEYTRIIEVGTNNTTGRINVTAFGAASVSTVLVSEITNNRVFFGLDNGNVVQVDDAHTNSPVAATIRDVDNNRYVSGIDVVGGDENHLMISYSNYGTVSIYETTNGGTSWVAVEGNLPDMPVRDIMFSPNDATKALAATETGVWFTDALNGASTIWTPCTNGMPNARVSKLEVRTADNQIIAATHGRGLFSTEFFSSPTVNFINTSLSHLEESADATTASCRKYKDLLVPVKFSPNPPSTTSVTISNDIATSSATVGKDFDLLTNSLSFGPGTPLQQDFTVRIYDDAAFETTPETIALTLSAGSFDGNTTEMSIVINDEDLSPNNAGLANHLIGMDIEEFQNGPFNGFYEDNKTQITYLAAELLAAGVQPGPIEALAFNVLSKSSTIPYDNFSVGLKQTTATTSDFETGFTTVYSGSTTSALGWNEFVFTTPFVWDGTSNLVVQTCFDNEDYTGDDLVAATLMSADYTKYRRRDNDAGCGLTSSATEIALRPNLRLRQNITLAVASTMSSSITDFIQVGDMYYLYNDNDELLIGLEQIDGSDLSCVEVLISRAGNGIQYPAAFAPSGVSDKAITVNAPGNVNYKITLFYTADELAAWGVDPNDLDILKTDGTIADATIANSTIRENDELTISTLGDTYAFTGSFNGFSTFALTNQSVTPLPVELISFTGQRTNKTNTLNWITESEINNRGFAIERSFDGQNFSEIGFVTGVGNSELRHSYELIDADLQKSGEYYYRLMQIDFDGTTTYSEIVVLVVEISETKLIAFPNPASDYLNITWAVESTEERQIELFHPDGKSIAVIKGLESSAGSTIVELTKYQLSNGVYYIRLSNGDKVIQTQRVIIMK